MQGENNGTDSRILDEDITYRAINTVFCATVACIATLGNALVLFVVCKNRTLRSPTYLFVTSLALADLFVGLITIPVSITGILLQPAWFHSQVFDFLITHSFTASTFSLCAISYDRYLAVTRPLRYNALMTNKRSLRTICIIWMMSLLLSSVNLMVPGNKIQRAKMHLIHMIIVVTLPFSLMSYFYWIMFKEAKKHAANINAQHQTFEKRRKKYLLTKESKTAVTVAIVIGVFALCWIPNLVMAITEVAMETSHCTDLIALKRGWLVSMAIAFTNSSLNPFIYAVRNADIRRAFHRAMLAFICQ